MPRVARSVLCQKETILSVQFLPFRPVARATRRRRTRRSATAATERIEAPHGRVRPEGVGLAYRVVSRTPPGGLRAIEIVLTSLRRPTAAPLRPRRGLEAPHGRVRPEGVGLTYRVVSPTPPGGLRAMNLCSRPLTVRPRHRSAHRRGLEAPPRSRSTGGGRPHLPSCFTSAAPGSQHDERDGDGEDRGAPRPRSTGGGRPRLPSCFTRVVVCRVQPKCLLAPRTPFLTAFGSARSFRAAFFGPTSFPSNVL